MQASKLRPHREVRALHKLSQWSLNEALMLMHSNWCSFTDADAGNEWHTVYSDVQLSIKLKILSAPLHFCKILEFVLLLSTYNAHWEMGKISHFQDKLCTSGNLKLGKEIRMFLTEVNSKARMITGLKLFCLSLFWNRKYKEQKTHAWMFLSSDKIWIMFVSKSFRCGTVDILILYNFSTTSDSTVTPIPID